MSDEIPTTPPTGDGSSPPPPPPPPPAAPTYAAPAGEQPLSPSDEKTFAMLAQFGGIVIGFLAGLLVMVIWGKRSAFVNDHAKEALNFQITLLIGHVIGFVLTFVYIGVLVYMAVWIVGIVFSIIAGMAANKGETYRYPFALRLVK